MTLQAHHCLLMEGWLEWRQKQEWGALAESLATEECMGVMEYLERPWSSGVKRPLHQHKAAEGLEMAPEHVARALKVLLRRLSSLGD